MSGGGGKGGSQSTEVSLPPWLDAASQDAVQRGQQISEIGYVPYNGPDVAALSQPQLAAMQGTNAAAGAFGLGQADPTATLPQATTYAGGIQGYSAAPMYDQLWSDFEAARPGQAGLINSFFVDPFAAPVDAPVQSGGGAGPAPMVDRHAGETMQPMGQGIFADYFNQGGL